MPQLNVSSLFNPIFYHPGGIGLQDFMTRETCTYSFIHERIGFKGLGSCTEGRHNNRYISHYVHPGN